jgi:hypothetical protein
MCLPRYGIIGHRTTTVTETVYRKQLRPVIEDAADGDGPHLPGSLCIVTQLVTQGPTAEVHDWPFWLVGGAGFETSAPSLVRAVTTTPPPADPRIRPRPMKAEPSRAKRA